MSIPTSVPGAPQSARTFDVSGTKRVPFLRLVGVESRKMSDTRAGLWLLGITLLIIIVAVGAVAWSSRDTGASFGSYLFSTAMPLQFLLPILGILLVTGEWGQRTTLSTFTLEPSRMRVMAAKIVSAIWLSLVAMAVAMVAAGVMTLLLGDDDPWADVEGATIFHLCLLLVLGVLQGVAFGALLLNSAGAIVAFFAVPILFSILTVMIPGWIGDNLHWIDLSTAQLPFMSNEWASAGDWGRLGVACAIWILLPMVGGLFRIARMELK